MLVRWAITTNNTCCGANPWTAALFLCIGAGEEAVGEKETPASLNNCKYCLAMCVVDRPAPEASNHETFRAYNYTIEQTPTFTFSAFTSKSISPSMQVFGPRSAISSRAVNQSRM